MIGLTVSPAILRPCTASLTIESSSYERRRKLRAQMNAHGFRPSLHVWHSCSVLQ